MASTKNKNSLIELMRFFFALWVLYYHSFVPIKTSAFSDGFLAVEFFFVLSGFYLIRSIDKYTSQPINTGLFSFLKHRFSAIAIPFLINEIFVLYYSIFIEASYNFFFGFLWYIRDLFVAMSVIFILRKLIKGDRKFYLVMVGLSVMAFFAFQWFPLMAWPGGPLRSIAAMPIGMLAALIPKLKPRKETAKDKVLIAIIIAVGLALSSIACLAIAYSTNKTLFIQYLLVIVVYPAMLYFASCVNFNNRVLNWIGSLSFPIYSFQCILRVVQYELIDDRTFLFILLWVLVFVYSAIMSILNHKKKNDNHLTI